MPCGAGTWSFAFIKTHLSHHGPHLSTPKPLYAAVGGARNRAMSIGITITISVSCGEYGLNRRQLPLPGELSSLAAFRQDADRARQLRLIHKDDTAGIHPFSVMRNKCDLLAKFVKHYSNPGVVKFVSIDDASPDSGEF